MRRPALHAAGDDVEQVRPRDEDQHRGAGGEQQQCGGLGHGRASVGLILVRMEGPVDEPITGPVPRRAAAQPARRRAAAGPARGAAARARAQRAAGARRGAPLHARARARAGRVARRGGGRLRPAGRRGLPDRPPGRAHARVGGGRAAARRRARAADERPPRFDFRPGGPDVSLFPRARLAGLAAARAARRARRAARLRRPARRARAAPRAGRYLGRVRGVAADPERVVVTSGMAQGMAVFARALARPGGAPDRRSRTRRARRAARSWRRTGSSSSRVPVDEEGLRVDALAALPARRTR